MLFHAKLWTFPADFLGGMVADKKEEGFQGFGHLGKPFDSQSCVCGTIILQLVLRREQSIQYDIYRLIEGQKKTIKGLMPEGTNSRCPLKVSKLA